MTSIQSIVSVSLSIGWFVMSASGEEREILKDLIPGINFMDDAIKDSRRFFPTVRDIIDNREFREKCLEGLGCFYNGPPFFHPLFRLFSFLPSDLKDMTTKFYLYPSKHGRVLIEPNDESFTQVPYKKDQDLLIFIPGYQVEFTPDILAASEEVFGTVLAVSTRNVIIVAWTASNKASYAKAVGNATVVGAQVAQLIKHLEDVAGLDPRKVHIIGHSLGAHIAGWAGERTPNTGRITGLDPAGPYFRDTEPKMSLDTADANVVDVIHTGASSVITEGSSKFKFLTCSHLQSMDIFNESVNNSKCKFIGTECPDYQTYRQGWCKNNKKAEMGFYAKKDPDITPGSKFYLTTSVKSPYCIPN